MFVHRWALPAVGPHQSRLPHKAGMFLYHQLLARQFAYPLKEIIKTR